MYAESGAKASCPLPTTIYSTLVPHAFRMEESRRETEDIIAGRFRSFLAATIQLAEKYSLGFEEHATVPLQNLQINGGEAPDTEKPPFDLPSVLEHVDNHRRIQRDTLSKATPNTGEWMFDNEVFPVWWNPKTGTCKTVATFVFHPSVSRALLIPYFSSIVVEVVEKWVQTQDPPICVCFLYIRSSDNAGLTVRHLEVSDKQTVEKHPDCLRLADGGESQGVTDFGPCAAWRSEDDKCEGWEDDQAERDFAAATCHLARTLEEVKGAAEYAVKSSGNWFSGLGAGRDGGPERYTGHNSGASAGLLRCLGILVTQVWMRVGRFKEMVVVLLRSPHPPAEDPPSPPPTSLTILRHLSPDSPCQYPPSQVIASIDAIMSSFPRCDLTTSLCDPSSVSFKAMSISRTRFIGESVPCSTKARSSVRLLLHIPPCHRLLYLAFQPILLALEHGWTNSLPCIRFGLVLLESLAKLEEFMKMAQDVIWCYPSGLRAIFQVL
ncbi:hypothetical protein BKA70DRAFT_1396009 [Coprinopsis sp. MPI-PUGE-AT-0042]|nr:hypothetical protein BKA70DRAFT_1396009 [Coprinopsis sp. MPI-PUGE-AT-0042]